MRQILILLLLAAPLMAFSFNFTVTPSIANLTNTLVVAATPTPNASLNYTYQFRSYTAMLRAYDGNFSYFIPASFNESTIIIDVKENETNSTLTKYALVNSAVQSQLSSNFVENQIWGFYVTYGSFVIGLIVLAIAYALSSSLSGTALTSAVVYFIAYALGGYVQPFFVLGAVALLFIGLILKYAGV